MRLPGYDEWLERPYREADDRIGAFEEWCEKNGYDLDVDDAAVKALWERFDAWLEDELDQDAAEIAAERRWGREL